MRGEGADRARVGLGLLGGMVRMRADGEIDRRRSARRSPRAPGAWATRVEIVVIRSTPAASARATTASISSAKSGKSRWQWLSIRRSCERSSAPFPACGERVGVRARPPALLPRPLTRRLRRRLCRAKPVKTDASPTPIGRGIARSARLPRLSFRLRLRLDIARKDRRGRRQRRAGPQALGGVESARRAA